MMDAFICDAIRTPIGRFGGALSSIRADDLAALSIKELKERNKSIDWSMVDEVIFGCANQSGEDNRNIARMSLLLAGLPQTVPGITINRLCASGLEAVTYASRMIKSNEAHLIIAGGIESMSRAPFVIPKSTTPFSRNAEIYDTTIGWRFINPIMRQMYGVDSMPETAENVAERWNISHSNFYLWGGMGGTAMIGLGLAMSIPDTPVIVITGDGEQLMGLGSLASIGVQKPNNLAIVVLDNGHFGETGMQKSHTSYGINLCKIAEASKFEFFFDVVSNNDLENLIEILPPVKGPIFANIKIKSQNPPRKLPILDGVELKNRFRKNLGVEPL